MIILFCENFLNTQFDGHGPLKMCPSLFALRLVNPEPKPLRDSASFV